MKEIDWSNLSFGYMKTDYNVRCYYRNGAWGEIEVCSEETIPLHMAATCLHYGQEAFEGLKAYRCPDGKVRVFRPDENAARLQSTCRGILMPELPTEKFIEMVEKVVRLNERFIPPYESGATLYVRPLLIGTSAQVGVHPSEEYLFLIFVTPVGPYFKGGFATNPYVIIREYDRSAPLGTGIYKVGGNYAASLKANQMAHDLGYSCEFYLDAKEKKYIDECGAANFFGIKDNTYVTPKSTSIHAAPQLSSPPSSVSTTWRTRRATSSARMVSLVPSVPSSTTCCATSSTVYFPTPTDGLTWSSNKSQTGCTSHHTQSSRTSPSGGSARLFLFSSMFLRPSHPAKPVCLWP